MFLGHNEVSLDERWRFAIPAKYRETIRERSGGRLVITCDVRDKCLLVYPKKDFDEVKEQLLSLDNRLRPNRSLQRRMLGCAESVELDRNGRVLVSAQLRKYAELSKKMVMIGQGNKLELWADAKWQETEEARGKEAEEALDNLTEKLRL